MKREIEVIIHMTKPELLALFQKELSGILPSSCEICPIEKDNSIGIFYDWRGRRLARYWPIEVNSLLTRNAEEFMPGVVDLVKDLAVGLEAEKEYGPMSSK